jgi:glycosyltransferase involved in cell wall biosynthesis
LKDAAYIKELYESDWAKEYRDEARQYLDIIRVADFTTSSTISITEQIRKYNNNSYVLPNSINKEQFAFSLKYEKKVSKDVCIVYMSGSPTHNSDFGEVENSLFRVLEENPDTKFIIVGYLKLPDHYGKLYKRQIIQYGMQDYLDLLKVLSRASINIAPLEASLFNDCKSELKIFEAALLGIPTIASNTRSYRECITSGHNGYIASTREDWYVMLNKLIRDEKGREKMGKNARAELVDRFSYLNTAKRAMEIYEMMYNEKGLGKIASRQGKSKE